MPLLGDTSIGMVFLNPAHPTPHDPRTEAAERSEESGRDASPAVSSIPSRNALAPLPNWVLSAKRRQIVTSDGHALTVSTWPTPKPKGTVVILQGSGQSAYRWQHTARFLSRHRDQQVITYDHRGKGLSGRLAEDNRCHIDDFRRYASDAIEVLTTLEAEGKLKAPVTLLGYSMGGAVAIDALSRRSDLADRLVLLAPMSRISPEAAKPRWLIPVFRAAPAALPAMMSALAGAQTFLGRGHQPAWGSQEERAAYFARGPYRSTANQERSAWEAQAAHVLPDMVSGAGTWRYFGQLARGAKRARELAERVTCPALIISAEQDTVVCSDSHSRLAERLPNCVGMERIPGAFHAPYAGLKHEQRHFYGALDRFFARTAS